MSRSAILCIPRRVAEAVDADTQSGVDIQAGDGSGFAVTGWEIYELSVHIRQVDQSLLTFGHAPAGVELGDIYFSVSLRDKDTVNRGFSDEYAYVFIDGKAWRITSVGGSGVGQVEEIVVCCRANTPRWFAPGYRTGRI